MASRTADTTLVTGAGDAYKNWENVPGMYAGLDKISEAGIQMMETARLEKQKAELEKKRQNKEWEIIRGDVLQKSGSFKSTTDRDLSFDIVSQIKSDYLAADNDKDKSAALVALQNEKDYINGVVDLRADIAANGLSRAMDKRQGGNTGLDKEILTSWLEENYTVKLINNERVFTGKTSSGHEYSLTKEQIEELYIPPNTTYSSAFNKVFQEEHDTYRFSRKNVERKVNQNLPKLGEYNDLYAFINDDITNNENFLNILDNDSNLLAEINNQFKNDPLVDTDTTPGISDDELEAFKLAIMDPNSTVWEGDKAQWEKYCRPIVVEKLAQAIENENRVLYPDHWKDTTITPTTPTVSSSSPKTFITDQGVDMTEEEIGWIDVDDITKVENAQDGSFYRDSTGEYEVVDGKMVKMPELEFGPEVEEEAGEADSIE